MAYQNLSVKSDFSQMRLSRSGFDYKCGAFCSDLILNEFKQIGFIRLIGCLILNVAIMSAWHCAENVLLGSPSIRWGDILTSETCWLSSFIILFFRPDYTQKKLCCTTVLVDLPDWIPFNFFSTHLNIVTYSILLHYYYVLQWCCSVWMLVLIVQKVQVQIRTTDPYVV